ncbi:tyrosine-type recombinase/integrase [Acinetobacter bereziniae]|uniref:tyrosine-type recombinase/integrase n=1 Tax=Acinetobacter bereziniae TaxID=106648 RepID=UPI0012506458|nr:site-specific integrase [Acinetobacter bereziniae]
MNVSFIVLLENFFAYHVLRADSQKTYKKIIHYFVESNEKLLPETLTEDDVVQWRKKVLVKIKPVSWNTYARHLHALMNFGIKQKILARSDNPFSNVKIKSDNKSIKYLNSYQITQLEVFMKECHQYKKIKFIKPIWFFITLVKSFQYTGMRKRQLLNLKIEDIKIDEGIIYIDGVFNKNHKSHQIPISSKLNPYLIELLEQHRKLNSPLSEQLFNINCFKYEKIKVRKMSIYQVDAIFRYLSEQLNFRVTPHRFRHTVATTILKNSNNIYMAQKILGHQSIRTTMQYIGHDIELLRSGIEMI